MVRIRIALIMGIAAASILGMLMASASLSNGNPYGYSETDIVDGEQADDSVRALFGLQGGLLTVQPASGGSASVAPLGAPGCIGQASDLRWHGAFEARWTPHKGETSTIFAFPADFEIVQPTDETAEMEPIKLGGTELAVYSPRYTDCHALETYFFGVRDGRAFPVSIRMDDVRALASIGRLPGQKPIAESDELVIIGGFAAGMETVPVYAFRYEPEARTLTLTRTEQRKLTELGG
ncbi:hypothetical protein SAMN02799624_06332 [Paenibacillus sp. UNC496MF]|uniref:hypothetical protein n=1 Tax=Paenibacillus sp. UNC496MF TaxID=1502753 RepID=UPI0008E7802D|nr:hypothetical protein [Paenibacillus sp. UNC496MF]SFJ86253.1 hypothetical protein SAMN02799624_06332 [Paenibacillus sp. UNC496MF]